MIPDWELEAQDPDGGCRPRTRAPRCWPPCPRSRVHAEPWAIGLVWAHNLQWAPVPVFQTNLAFTASLRPAQRRKLADRPTDRHPAAVGGHRRQAPPVGVTPLPGAAPVPLPRAGHRRGLAGTRADARIGCSPGRSTGSRAHAGASSVPCRSIPARLVLAAVTARRGGVTEGDAPHSSLRHRVYRLAQGSRPARSCSMPRPSRWSPAVLPAPCRTRRHCGRVSVRLPVHAPPCARPRLPLFSRRAARRRSLAVVVRRQQPVRPRPRPGPGPPRPSARAAARRRPASRCRSPGPAGARRARARGVALGAQVGDERRVVGQRQEGVAEPLGEVDRAAVAARRAAPRPTRRTSANRPGCRRRRRAPRPRTQVTYLAWPGGTSAKWMPRRVPAAADRAVGLLELAAGARRPRSNGVRLEPLEEDAAVVAVLDGRELEGVRDRPARGPSPQRPSASASTSSR